MSKLPRFFLILFLCQLGVCQAAVSAVANLRLNGAPLMQRYTAREFSSIPQQSTIATDKDGQLFVGNNEGILKFDGTSWELTELPGKQIVRTIIRARDNKMYVASVETFGELGVGTDGKTVYRELLTQAGLKGKDRRVGNVWAVFDTADGVYFQAEKTLFFFSFDQKTLRQWPLSENVRLVIAQGNTLYARVDGLGICKFTEGKFVLEPGGEIFASQPLAGMIDRGSWRLLVSDQRLYRADQSGIKLLPNGGGKELIGSDVYAVQGLTDGSFVLGTRLGEIFRFSQDFAVLERVKLGNYAVLALTADSEGGLWAATEGDLVRMAMPSPWSYLDATQGVQGVAYDFEWYENALWTASSLGVARIVPLANGSSRYEKKPWVNYEAYALNSSTAGLLIGHRTGLMVLEKGSDAPRQLFADQNNSVLQLVASSTNKNLLYALASHKLLILSKAAGKWQIEKQYPLADIGASTLVEMAAGEIWLSDNYAGPQRWRLNPQTQAIIEKKAFGKNDGLELQAEVPQHVYALDGKLHVVIGSKGYLFNGKRFEMDNTLPFTESTRPHEFSVSQTEQGSYAYTTREMWFRPKAKSEWLALHIGLGGAAGYSAVRLNQDGTIRISTWGGILQYNGKENPVPPEPLRVTFASVVAEKQDGKDIIILPIDSRQDKIVVPAGYGLRLQASMVSLASKTEFRYRISSVMKSWTAWSDRNLFIRAQAAGDYVVDVQARTEQSRETALASYRYSVLPHWYENIWMRLMLLFLGLALVFQIGYWIVRQRVAIYRKQNLKLEQRISERTIELEALNQQLSVLLIEDPLTGVANRRALEQGLEREWYRCMDQAQSFSALMIDVDHFKKFNDKHGHLEGDVVLREIAQTLKKDHDPKRELLARFGGEEFALLLPGVGLHTAVHRAEQIRQTMTRIKGNMTVSIGVAGFVPNNQIEQSSLLRRADAALYRAKRAGRNRVEVDDQ